MQSRRMSLVEAVTNTAAGFGVAMALNSLLLPLTTVQNLGLAAIYTAASVARGYAVRRLFERWKR